MAIRHITGLRGPKFDRIPVHVGKLKGALEQMNNLATAMAVMPAYAHPAAFASLCFEALKRAAELHRDLEVLAMDAGVPPTLIADEVY